MKEDEKMRNILLKRVAIVAMIAMMIGLLVMPVKADSNVKPKKITAVGKQTVTVYAGQDFELKVKMTPKNAEDDYLRWKILSGSKYIRFDDDDRSDDEIEMRALKVGTAKVRCYIKGTSKKVDFTVTVKKAQKKITAAVKTSRTVRVGQDFDLEVNKYAGLKDRYLKWSIGNKKIVRFDDDERVGDEVEFRAIKAGKTTVTCTNTKTNQKITFSIKVVK